MVAVISVDAYTFLAFSDLTCHLENAGIVVVFQVELCHLIIRTMNLEIAT